MTKEVLGVLWAILRKLLTAPSTYQLVGAILALSGLVQAAKVLEFVRPVVCVALGCP